MTVNVGSNQRKLEIDVLRAIGTFLVILAHVSIPERIVQFRSFDVVLLVFVSGMCIRIDDNFLFFTYLKKRIKRLVFPAWGFLCLLFSLTFVVCILTNRHQLYSFEQVIRSFFFLDGGIGFIWIVRVYLFVAIVGIPLIVIIRRTLFDWTKYIVVLLFMLLTSITEGIFTKDSTLLYYVYEAVMYSCVAVLGFLYNSEKEMSIKKRWGLVSLILIPSLIIVLFFSFRFGFIPDSYKYPPQLFYISFGLTITYFLLFAFERILSGHTPKFGLNCIKWVSVHSFDIYLWHILALTILNFCEDYFLGQLNYVFEYMIVLIESLGITYFTDRLKSRLLRTR